MTPLTFDKPLDPTQTLTVANFAIMGPDSLLVPIASTSAEARDTTVKAPAANPAPRRVAGNPRVDTTTARKAVMSRPTPVATVLLKLQRPLTPKLVYRVRAIAIHGLLGNTGNSERPFTAPAPPPPPKPTVAPAKPPPAVSK